VTETRPRQEQFPHFVLRIRGAVFPENSPGSRGVACTRHRLRHRLREIVIGMRPSSIQGLRRNRYTAPLALAHQLSRSSCLVSHVRRLFGGGTRIHRLRNGLLDMREQSLCQPAVQGQPRWTQCVNEHSSWRPMSGSAPCSYLRHGRCTFPSELRHPAGTRSNVPGRHCKTAQACSR